MSINIIINDYYNDTNQAYYLINISLRVHSNLKLVASARNFVDSKLILNSEEILQVSNIHESPKNILHKLRQPSSRFHHPFGKATGKAFIKIASITERNNALMPRSMTKRNESTENCVILLLLPPHDCDKTKKASEHAERAEEKTENETKRVDCIRQSCAAW